MKTQAELNAEAIAQAEDDKMFSILARLDCGFADRKAIADHVRSLRVKETTLREAVEVLGREAGEWRWMDEHWETAPTQKYLERQRALLSACHKTDANPTARAAVAGQSPIKDK